MCTVKRKRMASSGRIVSLVRQGCNEIPEIMLSGVAAILSTVACSAVMYRYYKNDGNNRKYKLLPVYMRPDDPRVAKVHKD